MATRRRSAQLAECKDCHLPIRFVRLDNGHVIPVNPKPNLHGNVAGIRVGQHLHGHVIARDKPLQRGHDLYMPHAATCVERQPAPKPEPPPTLF